MTLFEIGEDLLALDELIDSLGGDVSDPAVDAAITSWQESLANDQGRKLDGYCNLIKKLDAMAAIASAEAAEYSKRAASCTNRVKWLKSRMMNHMLRTGTTTLETATGRKIAIQGNGGKPPVDIVEDVDLTTIDQRFVRTKSEIDKEAIREAIANGESVPFARIGQLGTQLRIR
jgi:hypothetical protein